MKKIILFLLILTAVSQAQIIKTVTPTWVKGIASDTAQARIQSQDSLQIIDGVAKVLINPDDNHGLQISRPNDDVGLKIKVNDQKTGWIVFENQDGADLAEIEFDTDGTTKTFEIGTNTDYPVLIRSNGNNTVSVDDTKLAVDGYITGDSVLVGGRKLLKDNFYTTLDEQSAPEGIDKVIIVDGSTLKYTNVEDLFGSYFFTGTDSIHYGQDSIVVTHGVGSTPSYVGIQLTSNSFGYPIWINVTNSTTFSVKRSDVGLETITTYIKFKWMAKK